MADTEEQLASSLEGHRFGRYELGPRLARGGMGEVYLATTKGHAGVGKVFAVKTLRPDEDTAAGARFIDEARIAARLDHPHVCGLLDFGEEAGIAYLVMEYLDGEPFSAALQKEPLPLFLILRTLADAARGLHAAHELRSPEGRSLGLVHRDISPQNLFVLYDGPTKVLDFGVARVRNRVASTKAGSVRGKIGYLPPEMIEGAPIDRRADLWSFGVVLHEALSAQRLFRRGDVSEAFAAILTDPIPDPFERHPGAPASLRELVDRCLTRDPERRIRTSAEVADTLEQALVELSERADHARVSEWMKRRFAARLAAKRATLLGLRDAPATRVEVTARSEPPPAAGLHDAPTMNFKTFGEDVEPDTEVDAEEPETVTVPSVSLPGLVPPPRRNNPWGDRLAGFLVGMMVGVVTMWIVMAWLLR